jgi:RecG-like helicase
VLPGVGPAVTKRLGKLGLGTIADLLEHRPHRYEAAAEEVRIADLLAGEQEVAISGEVVRTSIRRPRRRLAIVQARIEDDSGQITAVWFNQAWLADKLKPGTHVRLRGHLRRNEFNVRSYDVNGASATADFAPVYPATEDLTVKKLRDVIGQALPTTCPSAPTRSPRCTCPALPRMPSSAASGSRSRSCSCSRSGSPVGGGGASARRRLRSASPAIWSLATKRCSRSS